MRLQNYALPFGLQLHKAFADESRVRLLHLLWRNHEMVVADLEQVLDFTQTKTSRQLALLKSAGLVRVRRLDNWMFYALADEPSDIVQQLLEHLALDPQLVRDQQTYQTLWSNRELAAYKLQNRHWRG